MVRKLSVDKLVDDGTTRHYDWNTEEDHTLFAMSDNVYYEHVVSNISYDLQQNKVIINIKYGKENSNNAPSTLLIKVDNNTVVDYSFPESATQTFTSTTEKNCNPNGSSNFTIYIKFYEYWFGQIEMWWTFNIDAYKSKVKANNVWKNACAWLKVNGSWKRCVMWKKINGTWKKGE